MAISIIAWLAALRYKAGEIAAVVPGALAPRPVYRIIGEAGDVFRVAEDEADTHRGLSRAQTTHRVSNLEAGE